LDQVIRDVCGPYEAVVPGSSEGLEKLKAQVFREDRLKDVLYNLPPLPIKH